MELTRAKYKEIKSYNKREMKNFLSNLYNEAYNTGVHTMAAAVSERVTTAIANTKGIGEKRTAELLANINTELNK